ncbi:carboxymuconolactone decarboxylase family protein [Spongiimicrobium salis]|uniref:carboxymuconolactone decarboxylase family protein n=1 Tax=Spongiimicrobium salis TaxID=1667022 RepID=UPI00374CBE6B
MSWIKTIGYDEAKGTLKKLYQRLKGPNNKVDNVLSIHSLRPHSLNGHMTLYKSVLHNTNNTLPKWYLEAIGVYVSYLNHCPYCVSHHFEGLKRLLQDDVKASHFFTCIENDSLHTFFDAPYFSGIAYAKRLTLEAHTTTQEHIEALKAEGFTEGEILEINQVTSYFNYVNRTVVGLGVNTKGDILGLSPNNSDDPSDWEHQ